MTTSTEGAAPAPQTLQPIHALLRDFSRLPECDRYSADSEKIELLEQYLWIRQLTPGLSFEKFLELFAKVANYDTDNLKHPQDAVKTLCPRSKAAADKVQRAQWSAAQVVDILVLYTDMIRLAESQGQPIPLDLKTFLSACGPMYLSGELPPPTPAPSLGRGKKTTVVKTGEPAPADGETGLVPTGNPLLPTVAGQRVIYAPPTQHGRQIKGKVLNVILHDGRTYIDFEADSGEKAEGCNVLHFTVVDEAVPVNEEPILERKKLWIPKTKWPGVQSTLALTTPMANVAIGGTIEGFALEFDANFTAEIEVVNGDPHPYVDAKLRDKDGDAVDDLNPRDSILGEYRFKPVGQTTPGVYLLEVDVRK